MSVANGGGAFEDKGRSLRSGLARPALPLTGGPRKAGRLAGRQGGQAAFAPTTRLRIHCRQERGEAYVGLAPAWPIQPGWLSSLYP